MSAADLSNTPGVYYALAYWLGGVFYTVQNPKRLKGGRLWLSLLGFLLLFEGLTIVTQGFPVIFYWFCMALNILFLYLMIQVCCGLPAMNAGYFCVKAFILGEFSASLEWQFYYFGLKGLGMADTLGISLLFLAAVHTVILAAMSLLERKFREENGRLQIHKGELLSAVTIGLSAYIVSNLSYVYKNTPFSSQFPLEVFIIRTLVDMGAVAILYAYHVQLQDLTVRRENEALQNILHMQYNDYKKSEESIAIVNQKYHDLKHLIALMRADIEADQKMHYLNQVEQEIKSYEAQNKTGNKVLDTVLTGKMLQGQNYGIHLTCVADGEALNFMDAADISTLFGNALDNAIESVRKIGNEEKRNIHVSVCRKKAFLCIRIENSYEGELVFKEGLPVTTKRDKDYHGYGMKSIRSIVEKYEGNVSIDVNNQLFLLQILIPVSK